MSVNNLLNYAINELNNLVPGTTFKVKDLFIGYYWNSISISERLTLGTLFLNFAKSNPGKISIEHKNSANQQLYKVK